MLKLSVGPMDFGVVIMIVPFVDDRGIPMTTLSHLEGGRGEHSDWPLVKSQGAGLMAPPMSMLRHTVVSSRSDGELYISSVLVVEFTWNLSSDRVTTLRRSRTWWDCSAFVVGVG